MQWLANISVRRAVFASVLMLSVVVVGLASYSSLGIDRFPNVDFPNVVVTTSMPGASPEEIETEISDKLEQSINTVAGVDELRSISSEGLSLIYVQFVLDKDINVASQEVRDAVNRAIPNLPTGVDPPVVAKMDPDATPILYISLEAPASVRDITETADKVVKRRLESVNGVGEVTLIGGTPRQINVFLDPAKLKSFGMTATEVQAAIGMQNITVPGGRLEAGSLQPTLRVAGKVGSVEDLSNLVVRERGDHPIHLYDVGHVDDGVKEAESQALLDGKPAVVLAIRKQSGTNTVQVVDDVRSRLEDVQKILPSSYKVQVVRDNSGTIRTSVDAVKEHLVLGAIFAALVVLLFLGSVRSTIIAAVAIPVSIIGTFALMAQQGFTLNTITMLALALAVGIVIDDAIVVLENIHRFITEKHVKPFPAAILATRDIGLAVLATTLSLMAVFLPVAFMGGVVGRFLKSFGLTMAFAIGVSLLVSFTLTPMLSARWLRPHTAAARDGKKPILERIVDSFYGPIERSYVRLLTWVMAHRWVVVVISLFLVFIATPVLMGKVAKGFLPKSDDGQFQVEVRAPEGTRLEEAALDAERIARQIRELPGVDFTMVTVGDSLQRLTNLATIYVHLTDPRDRKLTALDLEAKVRDDILPRQPQDLRVTVGDVPMFAGGWKNVNIMYELTGPDLKELEKLANNAVLQFKKIPGAVDVDSDLVSGNPELVLHIDRAKAADLGVRVADIANALRILVGGVDVSQFREGGEEYEIHVRADRSNRSEASLDLVTVPSSKLGSIPLSTVVRAEKETGAAVINRNARRRQVMLTANSAPGYSEGAIGAAWEKVMTDAKLPPGYKFAAAGRSKEMAKTMKSFGMAIGLMFIFMYLVLAAQFESWLHPLTIMSALPLTVPFAAVSLILLGQQLDIYSMLGILVLFGMVKKNGILQVDHTNNLRAAGRDRLTAIIEANRDRLRPILMTTLAFVAGMMPLALSKGIGAGFNQATAGVIVGGQVLSLLLTLVATPVTYSILDDLTVLFRRVFGGRNGPTDEEMGKNDIEERKLHALEAEAERAA